MKRLMILLTVVFFAGSSLLMMTSCAKKQVKGDEQVTSAKEPAKASDDDAAKREAERLARLQAMEKEQKLRGEMNAFEAESIYFDFDKADIKPAAKATLTKKADWLRANPQFSVRIEGNCDERGTNEYNLALGEKRAKAATKVLNALGISNDRLSTISYGEERPADPGKGEKAWSKNRRDEFKLSK